MEPDPADALDRVVREARPDAELVRLAVDELIAGRSFSDLTEELVANGWPAAEVEAAVEEARILTRRQRGVVTRADVVGDLDFRYRSATTGMATFYRSSVSLLGIFGFLGGLRSALAAARRLRQLSAGRTHPRDKA